jgi:hypothetical protein
MVAVQTGTRYTGTFHGRAEEVSRVRREIADHLGGCPVADDLVFIASDSLNLSICSLGPFCCFSGRGWRGFRGRLWCLRGG